MNKLWEAIHNGITQVASRTILYKWITSYDNTPKPKKLVTHYDRLKKLNRILLKFRNKRVKSKTWPIEVEWEEDIITLYDIINNTDLPMQSIPDHITPDNVIATRKYILDLYRNIKALSKIEENNINTNRIKHFIYQRCLQYETSPGRMIQSALGRNKKQIVLDRLLITTPSGSKELVSDPIRIKTLVNNHFQNYTIPTTPATSLSDRWLSQYAPKEFVNSSWYDHLMDPPSFEEWTAVIAKLPNEKAAGLSEIHNEQIKHLGTNLQHLLWKLVQICFIIGDIPSEWKIAHVYPISKPMEWGCDITKTRPITLLETTRKAFVKIITNRLSSIIAKHKICKGNNFAGLS